MCSARARRLRRDCRRAARCATYLTEMISTSDQRISDSRPSTFGFVDGDAVLGIEAFAQRVQRAGADVAEDDAESGEDELAIGVAASVRDRRAVRRSGAYMSGAHCTAIGGMVRRASRAARSRSDRLKTPTCSVYSTTDASQPRPMQAAEYAAPSRRQSRSGWTCPALPRARTRRALHDQRAAVTPAVVEPPGERECERDAGDRRPGRRTPACDASRAPVRADSAAAPARCAGVLPPAAFRRSRRSARRASRRTHRPAPIAGPRCAALRSSCCELVGTLLRHCSALGDVRFERGASAASTSPSSQSCRRSFH